MDRVRKTTLELNDNVTSIRLPNEARFAINRD